MGGWLVPERQLHLPVEHGRPRFTLGRLLARHVLHLRLPPPRTRRLPSTGAAATPCKATLRLSNPRRDILRSITPTRTLPGRSTLPPVPGGASEVRTKACCSYSAGAISPVYGIRDSVLTAS